MRPLRFWIARTKPSVQPIINQVPAIIEADFGFHQVQSGVFYDHFSLLRTVEGGIKLPCLNTPAMQALRR